MKRNEPLWRQLKTRFQSDEMKFNQINAFDLYYDVTMTLFLLFYIVNLYSHYSFLEKNSIVSDFR